MRYLQWLSSVAEKEYRKMKSICMLSSVAVALLLWSGRITSCNGISSSNSHDSFLVSSSNYRQRQLERYTNQWPTLQAHHQQHIHQFIRQLRQPLPIPRFLQTTNGTAAPSAAPPPPPPMLCNATTGLVNFYDDDFNSNLFGTPSDIYDSICTCEEETNTDEIADQLALLDFTDEAAFVAGFNTLIGQLASSSNYTCTNQCSSCFTPLNGTSKLCGSFSVEESSSVQNKMGNFTLQEIFGTFSDDDLFELVDKASFYSENCIKYSGDAFGNSEVCFTVDYLGVPTDSEPIHCNITYNDVLCNSCLIPGFPTSVNSTANSTDEEDCIIADCTNVDAIYGTMIDVCQNIGLDGPFQYFALKDVVNGSTFTPGTCDDVDIPVATPTVAVPVVSSPSSTNTSTEMPTTAPVLITGPTSDDNSTTITKSPIRAPAPVLPAPITELPSGTARTLSTLPMCLLAVTCVSLVFFS